MTQPRVWDLWQKKAPSLRRHIHFCVHAPQETLRADPFSARHSLHIDFGPTAWCHASLVYEHVRALRVALLRHGDRKCKFYMVSGADIPAKPPQNFFEDYETIIGISKRATGQFHYNSQWMGFTTADAVKVVGEYLVFPGDSPSAAFNEDVLSATCPRPELKEMRGCPDELVITRLVERGGLTDYHRPRTLCWEVAWTSTDGISNQSSPVNWYSSEVLFPQLTTKTPAEKGICGPGEPCEFLDLVKLHKAHKVSVPLHNPRTYPSWGVQTLPFVGFKRMMCVFRLCKVGYTTRKVTRDMPFESLRWFYDLIYSQDVTRIEEQLSVEIEADAANTKIADPALYQRAIMPVFSLSYSECVWARKNPDVYAINNWY